MTREERIARVFGGLRLHHLSPNSGPLILMYHGIGGAGGVAVEAFARHLDMLLERRRVVSLRQAIEMLGRPEATEMAALTFDDGYRDFADLALPAIIDRNMHATLFVPAGRMGGYNDWDEGKAPKREILSQGELRQLDSEHVEIGAHGYSHCRIIGLDRQALLRETSDARNVLEQAIGREVMFFAYPYGQRDDFDMSAEHAIESAGFRAACSTCFGRGSRPSDRYRLRRVGIEPADCVDVFRAKLEGHYDWMSLKERAGARLRAMQGALN